MSPFSCDDRVRRVFRLALTLAFGISLVLNTMVVWQSDFFLSMTLPGGGIFDASYELGVMQWQAWLFVPPGGRL
mgnify:CR=1 FL=1